MARAPSDWNLRPGLVPCRLHCPACDSAPDLGRDYCPPHPAADRDRLELVDGGRGWRFEHDEIEALRELRCPVCDVVLEVRVLAPDQFTNPWRQGGRG